MKETTKNNTLELVKLLSIFENDDKIDLSENDMEALRLIKKMKRLNEIKRDYQDKIKRRADGRQIYVYIDRKQISAKTENELYEKIYNILYGKENYSMADVFPLFLQWKRDNTSICGRTLKNNYGEWNTYFIPHDIIHIPMRDITIKDFKRLFQKWTCKREMTLHKFNNLKSLINGIYSFAIEELEIINSNPTREISNSQFVFKKVRNEEDVYSIEDRQILLEHLKDNDDIYSLAIQFDFHQTLRIGELLSLQWENIKGNQIYVENQLLLTTEMDDELNFSKYKHETVDYVKCHSEAGYRFMPITDEGQKILDKVRLQNPKGKYIFMRDGKQLYTNHFNEHLEKYCKECGVEYRPSHKIRFCVASLLYTKGVPLPIIQKLLGHTSLQMTLHYIRNVIKKDIPIDLIAECLK